ARRVDPADERAARTAGHLERRFVDERARVEDRDRVGVDPLRKEIAGAARAADGRLRVVALAQVLEERAGVLLVESLRDRLLEENVLVLPAAAVGEADHGGEGDRAGGDVGDLP